MPQEVTTTDSADQVSTVEPTTQDQVRSVTEEYFEQQAQHERFDEGDCCFSVDHISFLDNDNVVLFGEVSTLEERQTFQLSIKDFLAALAEYPALEGFLSGKPGTSIPLPMTTESLSNRMAGELPFQNTSTGFRKPDELNGPPFVIGDSKPLHELPVADHIRDLKQCYESLNESGKPLINPVSVTNVTDDGEFELTVPLDHESVTFTTTSSIANPDEPTTEIIEKIGGGDPASIDGTDVAIFPAASSRARSKAQALTSLVDENQQWMLVPRSDIETARDNLDYSMRIPEITWNSPVTTSDRISNVTCTLYHYCLSKKTAEKRFMSLLAITMVSTISLPSAYETPGITGITPALIVFSILFTLLILSIVIAMANLEQYVKPSDY